MHTTQQNSYAFEMYAEPPHEKMHSKQEVRRRKEESIRGGGRGGGGEER